MIDLGCLIRKKTETQQEAFRNCGYYGIGSAILGLASGVGFIYFIDHFGDNQTLRAGVEFFYSGGAAAVACFYTARNNFNDYLHLKRDLRNLRKKQEEK